MVYVCVCVDLCLHATPKEIVQKNNKVSICSYFICLSNVRKRSLWFTLFSSNQSLLHTLIFLYQQVFTLKITITENTFYLYNY